MDRDELARSLDKFFGQAGDRDSDVQSRALRLLASLPRCSSKVVIAHAGHAADFQCRLVGNATSLAPWAEHHAKAVLSVDRADQAARSAFPAWLATADPADVRLSFVPQAMYNAYRDYVPDILSKGLVQADCPECGRSFRTEEITRTELDKRKSGKTTWWTSEWHCPSGHLLYRKDHEIRFF